MITGNKSYVVPLAEAVFDDNDPFGWGKPTEDDVWSTRDYDNKRYGDFVFLKKAHQDLTKIYKTSDETKRLSYLDILANSTLGKIIKANVSRKTTVEKIHMDQIGDFKNALMLPIKPAFGHVRTFNKKTRVAENYRLSTCLDLKIGQFTIPIEEFDMFEDNTRYMFFNHNMYFVIEPKKLKKELGFETGKGNISFQLPTVFAFNSNCIVTFGAISKDGKDIIKEDNSRVPLSKVKLEPFRFNKRRLSSCKTGFHHNSEPLALIKLTDEGDIIGKVFSGASSLRRYLKKNGVTLSNSTINRHARKNHDRLTSLKKPLSVKIKKHVYIILSMDHRYEAMYFTDLIRHAYYHFNKYKDPRYVEKPRWSAYSSLRRFITIKSREEMAYYKGLLTNFAGVKKKYSLHDLYLFMAERYDKFVYKEDFPNYHWYSKSRLKCQLTA